MREALAGFFVIWILFATFWPAAIGESLGASAGKFMRSFDAAYRKNASND
jgi:lauroyl/myristoyl acyltransferase